jgi:chromatin assembly factor 1 subunit B
VPLFTPPQTPGHHVNGSVGSVSGVIAGVKRPSDASEAAVEEGRGEKKRRIAPTPVEGLAPPPPILEGEGST